MKISDAWFEFPEVDANAACCTVAKNSESIAFSYASGWILWRGSYNTGEPIRFCPFCGSKFPSAAALDKAFDAYVARIDATVLPTAVPPSIAPADAAAEG